MNTERLNHLITVLEGVSAAKKAFNLSAWAMNERLGDGDLTKHRNTVGDVQETCGTACCALGYAALDPLFVEAGLRLQVGTRPRDGDVEDDFEPNYPASIKEFNTLIASTDIWLGGVWPEFGAAQGFGAGQEFFGISYAASEYLFDPGEYGNVRPITPEMVIDRVREVIELDGHRPDEDDC